MSGYRLARPETMQDAGMGEQWATLVAASIGVLGVLAGIYVGRRQTIDQARIEHGQWLRGQRQEAYVALLDAWDTRVKEFQEMVDDTRVAIYYHLIETYEGDVWEESEQSIWSRTNAISRPAQRAIERVELLGPKGVDEACSQLARALKTLGEATRVKAGTETWPDLTVCGKAWEQAEAARAVFLVTSRSATRTAPAPGRRRS
jgi:hypothetical protein